MRERERDCIKVEKGGRYRTRPLLETVPLGTTSGKCIFKPRLSFRTACIFAFVIIAMFAALVRGHVRFASIIIDISVRD